MADEIHKNDAGKYSFAFVGEDTWHRRGQPLTPGSPIPIWIEEAGFNFDILSTPVCGILPHAVDTPANRGVDRIIFPERHLLYRSDSKAPLSVVSSKYKIVQPREVLEFYEDLVEAGGFHLETAGVLFGGKRMFALAKVADDAKVAKKDIVKAYLLLSTSCDGSLATTAQFTSVRVVCNNTLRMAIRDSAGDEKSKISIPHSAQFDARSVKEQLGLAGSSFKLFMEDMRRLADKPLRNHESIAFLVGLFGDPKEKLEDQLPGPANLMKQVYELYNGKARGSDMAGKTAWGMLNAVTEYTDHHTGHKTDDARINSAWFGQNANLKQRAYEDLMLMVD